MKTFNEFRTNESVDEGKTYSDGGKSTADYYNTDNESSVSFSIPFGTLLVSLNGPRDMGTKTTGVGKTKKEMERIQKIMYALYKSKEYDEYDTLPIEKQIAQIVSYGNVRMGREIEKAEKLFEKQLLSIIAKQDAKIAKQLTAVVMPEKK